MKGETLTGENKNQLKKPYCKTITSGTSTNPGLDILWHWEYKAKLINQKLKSYKTKPEQNRRMANQVQELRHKINTEEEKAKKYK